MVDFQPVAQALQALVYAAVVASIPGLVVVAIRFFKRMGVSISADQAARIEKAADAAAGVMYNYATTHEGGLANVAVKDAALAAGLNHLAASVPGAMAALGITPDHAAEMVKARFGTLLAADPSVTAGAPAVVPQAPAAILPIPVIAMGEVAAPAAAAAAA